MFGLLKKAFDSFTKKAESEADKSVKDEAKEAKQEIKQAEKVLETEVKAEAEIKEEKKGLFGNLFSKKEQKKAEAEEVTAAEPLKELKKIEEKVGFLESITKVITETKISGEHFDKIFSGLETELLQNNVSVAVIDKIKEKLKGDLVESSVKRGQVAEIVRSDLKDVIYSVLTTSEKINLAEKAKMIAATGRPAVFLFVGANGHGKTTTIAKVANYLNQNGVKCVFSASDTFRAASIEQLEEHAKKLGVRVVKQTYGSDPAAVAFDAIKHATANKIDCVLIDSAGRQHTNANLMDELKKLKRVAKPDITVFVGESIAGNDVVRQITDYNSAIGIDGIILTKVDVDDKGGAIVSAVQATGRPVLFLGVGQEYKDLVEFKAGEFVDKIL